MTALTRQAQPPLPVALDRLRGYGKIMLATLDQLTATNARAPQMLRFRDWAVFGEANAARYLGFWLDEARLYHLDLDVLSSKRYTDRLALAVRKPVFALRDPALGFMYVVQLAARPASSAPVAARLPERVSLDLSTRPAGDLYIPLGVTLSGPRWIDLGKPLHILIGGLTQHGKSSFEQAALLSIASAASPARVQFAIVDPKGEFVHWYQSPHLFAPVARDIDSAVRLLATLTDELTRRRGLFEAALCRNLAGYNAQTTQPLPVIVVIVDEFVDLAATGGKRNFIPLLKSLSSKAASYGIRLIMSATSTKTDVIDSVLRQQCDLRIAFRCTDRYQSEAILGDGQRGGVGLAGPGRLLAVLAGEAIEAQGYYVDDVQLAAAAVHLARRWTPAAPVKPVLDLTPDQKQLVLHALQHLGGYFKLRELSREFYGTQTPRQELRDLANQWEKSGLLLPAAAVNASRQISRVLRDAVGWVEQPK